MDEWRPYKVYEGLRLKYTRNGSIARVRKIDSSWGVEWEKSGIWCISPASGVRENELHSIWEPIEEQIQVETKCLTLYAIKEANTRPNATHCISCNHILKDPGMGPAFKYCPKCEP